MTKIEEDFSQLIKYIESKGEQAQKVLKEIEIENVPEKFRESFVFYKSLSNPSKQFMFKIAKGSSLKKKFIR